MTLREWMDREGLSNSAMALRCGVAANTVSRWRNRTRLPRISDLAIICQVTGGEVTANDFYHAPSRLQRKVTASAAGRAA